MLPTLLAAALAVSAFDDPPIPVVVPADAGPVSYANDLADVLSAKCLACHNEALAEGKLNMEEVSGLLKGGKRGPAVVPGKADASLLFTMSAHRAEPAMPPKAKKDLKPLTPEELGRLKVWIDAGAKDDSSEAAEPAHLELGELPPGIHPVSALDLTTDGARIAAGWANVVQVIEPATGVEVVTLGGHKDLVQSVRFSPNGRRLAAGSYEIVTVWDAPTGALKATLKGHAGKVNAVAASADGATVVSGGADKTVRVWDAAGAEVRKIALPSPVLALALSPDGALVAAAGDDAVVRLRESATGRERTGIAGQGGAVTAVAFLDAARLATASADGSVRVWTLPASPDDVPDEPRVFSGSGKPLRALAATSDGKILVAAGDEGDLTVWDVETGRVASRIASQGVPVLSLALSPDDTLIVAGSSDKTARVYEREGGALKWTLTGHLGPVNAVGLSSDGKRLATAGGEGAVKVWDTATGRGVVAFGHAEADATTPAPVLGLAFAGNGSIVSASAGSTLKRWEFAGDWSGPRTFGPHAFRVLAIDFNPDGTLLAAGGGEPSRSGEIQVWEVGKGLHVRTLSGVHSDTVFGLRFSPDGTRLASAGADKFLKVTNVSDGKVFRSFEGHTNHVLAVDWKADGQILVSAGADNVVKLWSLETGDQIRTFQPAGKAVTALRWLTGMALVMGTSGDGVVRVWNADNGSIGRQLGGADDYLLTLTATADGARVYAGGADGALAVWNGRDGKLIRKTGAAAAPSR